MHTRAIRHVMVMVAALVVAVGAAAVPATADPASGVVVCPVGSTTTNSSPGLLLLQPRMVTTTVTAAYSCTVANGLVSFRTGTSSVTVPPTNLTCLTPLHTPPASQTVHWSTGGSSTLTGTTTIDDLGGVVVATDRGVVTAGDFLNQPYVSVVEYTALSSEEALACLSEPGLTHRYGTATLTIG